MTALALAVLLLGGSPAPQGVRWEHRFDEAMKRARAAKKPVMIDFWAEWCSWCHRLDQTTYVDPVVTRLSEHFVAVKVDTEAGRRNAEIALRYNVSTLPTIAFLSPSGRLVHRLNGFQGPGQFPKTMEAAREAAHRVMAWEAALEKDPSDPAALFSLGRHLFEQEFYEDSRALLYKAIRRDDARPVDDRKQARMLIGIIQNFDNKYAEGETVLKEALALRPPSEFDPKMLYILGRLYQGWGRMEEARKTYRHLLAEHADAPVAAKAKEALGKLEK